MIESSLSSKIFEVFVEVHRREAAVDEPPELTSDTVLLETGLDSMGFAVLVVELEDALGFDPFSLSPEPFYPQTYGEFVAFYEQNQPR